MFRRALLKRYHFELLYDIVMLSIVMVPVWENVIVGSPFGAIVFVGLAILILGWFAIHRAIDNVSDE